MDIRQTIVNILTEVKPTKNLEGIEDIVEGGYIDSFEIMAIITAITEQFGIEIEIDEIVPENFNSIDAMVNMVNRLK